MVSGKKIVDEISGWLTLYDNGSVDRTWSGAPRFKFLAEPVPPHKDFVNGVATRDTVIDSNIALSVRLYLPDTPNTTNLPIILHLYGGGFCIGSPDWFMYYNIYTRIARASGAIVVSPYLRRAPEHRLPAAIDDGYSTLLWLKELANKKTHEPWVSALGDFNRIFLIGDSSGGNLVHQVARKAAQENLDPLRVAGVVPIHPGFVRSVRSKSELEAPESTFLTLHMLDKFMELWLPEGSTKDHPMTCPMAEPVDDLNLPPYLLCVAEKDLILLDTEIEFYETMKKANKKIELLMSYGMGHVFYLNKIDIDNDPQTSDETEKFVQGIANFVKSH
nr:probable carboxylesterase 15 [Tanacetum cinerariifolium]